MKQWLYLLQGLKYPHSEHANNEEYVEKEDEFDANVPMVPKETNEAYTNEAIVIM